MSSEEQSEMLTGGRDPIEAWSMDKLKTLDAGSKFSKSFDGERIPELGEVLDRFGGLYWRGETGRRFFQSK